jgi:hypothetical protein
VGSAAGAPLSQAAGAESERVQKDVVAQQRSLETNQKAESAAGIGETHEDQESSERDADGRRPWEGPVAAKSGATSARNDVSIRQSKDATGQCGSQLDLTG